MTVLTWVEGTERKRIIGRARGAEGIRFRMHNREIGTYSPPIGPMCEFCTDFRVRYAFGKQVRTVRLHVNESRVQ